MDYRLHLHIEDCGVHTIMDITAANQGHATSQLEAMKVLLVRGRADALLMTTTAAHDDYLYAQISVSRAPAPPPPGDARYTVARPSDMALTLADARKGAEHMAYRNPSSAVSIWRETATCKSGGIEWSDA